MRKLIMWNVITLDGYFEGEKNWDLSFHGLIWGKELEEFSLTQLRSADMLVFGAKTYQGMADYWTSAPEDEGEVAKFMNELPKLACSTTLMNADWKNTTITKDAVGEVSKLKKEGSGDMFVFGSGILSGSFMKAGLFDEYRICIAPIFLGKGRHLFLDGIPNQELKLIETKPLSTGGVILTYIP
ncbi:dihydrofolate reductase family protein [Leptospira sp. 2 VSF19]|uniref:Dihydrofolate reductase family protein n=1 Tax=Leptospira soteropolitanensis TaxID=2950025 RepID=A0AAW5VJB4_9LEPT|nr:dihydrofolate reductase family protein [Leptospira soteropolitanensis]MCW7491670.1 dihydrofolate reductase family protein [Leptospira soteropolitanensis]MCW7499254.1 dihydrofolate reductase family protein [Leptospira soteropolitanensis]MCW7521154.1 dihydrofolate reductase family protein [Leptospira soteropolitanensis]MCW7525358.1 dihydrofolate reductase family protein [Leptospira soteropolitanensis]MCW7529225.1 dihydrofolate reductase family protein [Leptospira soteropolitanensis]